MAAFAPGTNNILRRSLVMIAGSTHIEGVQHDLTNRMTKLLLDGTV
ncbi:Uncharacterised protein [Vibrio cholerae]|nr:Uncharacterised protein [Vibrio cholerae]